MKKSRIVVCLLACAIFLSLLIYHLPQRRQVTMPVCSATEETAQLEIDVKYYRRLFSTPWVEGTVTWDGVVYHDNYADLTLYNVEEHGGNSSFWGWDFCFTPDENPLPSNMIFIKTNPDETEMTWLHNSVNRIQFVAVRGNDTFDRIAVIYSDKKLRDESGHISGIVYYGPARSMEEARQIAEAMGYNFG